MGLFRRSIDFETLKVYLTGPCAISFGSVWYSFNYKIILFNQKLVRPMSLCPFNIASIDQWHIAATLINTTFYSDSAFKQSHDTQDTALKVITSKCLE
jgi:hypothetical protein